MTSDTVWNSLEIAKIVVGVLTPFVVAAVGYLITRQLKNSEFRTQKEFERDREERLHRYEEQKDSEHWKREEQKAEIERRYTPHIELRIDCKFFGPRHNQFLAVFYVQANNKGQVVHKFPSVVFRVRGIKGEQFQYWKDREPRAYFPHKIFETELVPSDWNFIFVEPGVSQQITLTTVIPEEYSYISAYAEFAYREYWPHTAEAVFALPKDIAQGSSDQTAGIDA
jgi:hypothetical protein